jgi:uncharacterized protein (DUF2062 family)
MVKKLKETIKGQLTQGVTSEKLAQSLSAGLLIGCFPLLGFTTGLAALFGVIFKLNHLVVQAANYLMYPVQIILIPIYIKVVSLLIDVGDVPIRPDLMLKIFADDWGLFLKKYGVIAIYAILLWFVVSSIMFLVLQKVFKPAIEKLKQIKG